jgi:hypothetical protein
MLYKVKKIVAEKRVFIVGNVLKQGIKIGIN